MERILEQWDLFILVVVASCLLLGVTIAEILRAAGISRRRINYGAITSYAVLMSVLLFGTSTLRRNLTGYANVDKFLGELASSANNQFAKERLMQLRPMLEEFKTGQITTGATAETMYHLMGAYEAVQPGMVVTVVGGEGLYGLDEAANLKAAERAAAIRGATVLHVNVGDGVAGDGAEGGDRRITYSQANQIESFRLHGGGSVFSFGGIWFAEINLVQSGAGESAKGRFVWGRHAEGLESMVKDISRVAARTALSAQEQE